MQCKDVETVLEQEDLAALPQAAKTHLASCASCQGLLADLSIIVATAHELPIEAEPPARVWVSIRAQLEAEGLISAPKVTEQRGSSWRHAFAELFRSRGLASATVGLLILGSAVYQLKGPNTVPGGRADLFADTAIALSQQERDLSSMQLASTSPVDTSFRQNLQTVDEFISECERRLKEEPQDELAREYLSRAYQQKAELLSAMMEQAGSLH
jgi:hypothetical protein